MRIRYSRYIETDLDEIAEYIARDNPVRALSFVQELRAEMSRIARNPRGYRVRPELGPGIRAAAKGKYLILFRIDENIVLIRRVVHGARNLGSMPT